MNMKVTVIPIVIRALGTVHEPEDLKIRERVETIQTTALLGQARILRRVLETWGDYLSDSSGKPSTLAVVKNSQKSQNNNYYYNDNNNGDTNYRWCTQYSHQRIRIVTGRLGNKRTRREYPNYSIDEIGQNTEKNPIDLSRQAVT